MKIPRFLLGATLIFWGWQTNLWILAIPMAILLEGSYWIQWRWDFSSQDIKIIANLSLIFLISLIAYFLIINRSIIFIYTFLQWLPIVFFPILLVQSYNESDRIDIRNLSLLKNQNLKSLTLNLNYPYFALTILSASATNLNSLYFYIGIVLLLAVAFWSGRSQRFLPVIWLSLLLIAGSLGMVGAIGLHNLHLAFEQKAIDWFAGWMQENVDPFQRRTAIGDIGRLKLSNNIFFRVKAEPEQTAPFLLREATYNKYNYSQWFAVKPEFSPVKLNPNHTAWQLTSPPKNHAEITITEKFKSGKGVLKLPDGAFQINQLPLLKIEKNQYGMVKVETNPGSIAYQVQFNPKVELDSPPTQDDLQIPNAEKAAITQIVKQLELSGKPPQEIIKRIQTFFEDNFSYSLDLIGKDANTTPLSAFLLKNRKGHCEYFATATTLLLRAAGIPARYAIGFSVNEFSALENQFIVRGRDGHAWTMVYLDGIWQELDTTPAGWSAFEDAAASKWGIISDIWSWLAFQLSLKLGQIKESNLLKNSGLWIAILILIGIWKLNPKKRVRRLKRLSTALKVVPESQQQGIDSGFYKIEKTLNQLGFFRLPSEPLKQWIERIQEELPSSIVIKDIHSIVDLHYRYRFDPKGIQDSEKNQLKQMIQVWLKQHSQPLK